MCVRVGIHVCVLGWAFMCVLGWAFMYDRDIDFASVSTICY